MENDLGGSEQPDESGVAASEDTADDSVVATGFLGFGPMDAHEWQVLVAWVIAIGCGVVVLLTVGGELLLENTTPTGGDMGAHVWGPEYLKTELLPNFRLTGWTPDWYAGFPAFVFYMVVPSLFIVWLDAGIPLLLGVPAAIGVLAGGYFFTQKVNTRLSRILIWVAAAFVAVLLLDFPYNIAFKLVAVSGLVTLPVAAMALGRAARVPFPGAPLLAIGATFFLYEGGFSILGGNILSTMAGEFAFSISLTFAVLYLAVLFKGIETGRYRALGALLFALVILNHLIPAIFAFIATVVIVLVRREDRTPWWDSSKVGRWIGLEHVVLVGLVLWLVPEAFPVVATLVALVMLGGFDRRALKWSAVVIPVGALLSAFWFVPFYLNSAFLNDMGWEKYTNYACYLWPQSQHFDMANRNVWFALAGAGMVLSLVYRVRFGWFLTLLLATFGWAFVFLPQYRLWNARLLPFYYLVLYLLAGLAVALVIKAIGLVIGDLRHQKTETLWVTVTGTAVASVIALVYVLGSLQALPGGEAVQVDSADGGQESAYQWMGLTFKDLNNASGWATHNFTGLESKPAWGEFQAMVDMMDQVGQEHGCGRTMWEYEKDIGRFGTPMAPMLLPYFTDGCIGSMEGLYFEASATTPYHFINQSELSPEPSRAQRDLPYPDFDIDAGVQHLQLMGVPYYLASTEEAVSAARDQPELTELASTGPFPANGGTERNWVVFEVADSETVVPLENLPVVLEGGGDHIDGWVYDEERPEADSEAEQGPDANSCPASDPAVPGKTPGPAMDWYLDPTRWDTPLATSGPDDWPTVSPQDAASAESVPVAPVTVTDVVETNDSISFTVSDTGSPVLVKTSYFPNWKASGADGPYRVSPNYMVVVPTENEVTLSYGRTGVDWLAWLLTAAGIGLFVILARSDERRRSEEQAEEEQGGLLVSVGESGSEVESQQEESGEADDLPTEPGDTATGPDGADPDGADSDGADSDDSVSEETDDREDPPDTAE